MSIHLLSINTKKALCRGYPSLFSVLTLCDIDGLCIELGSLEHPSIFPPVSHQAHRPYLKSDNMQTRVPDTYTGVNPVI